MFKKKKKRKEQHFNIVSFVNLREIKKSILDTLALRN